MGSAAKFLQGGLLSGLGEGIMANAEAKRREALLMLQNDNILAREQARDAEWDRRENSRRTWEEERDNKNHERAKGLIRERKEADSGSEFGLSPEENRLLEKAMEAATTVDEGVDGGTYFDRKKAEDALKSQGGEHLIPLLPEDAKAPLSSDPDWIAAGEDASDWAKGKAGLLRPDKTDFKEWGGSRKDAIAAKQREYYNEMKGLQGEEVSAPNAVAQASSPEPDSPTGDGAKFTSPDAVKAAYEAGELSREEAIRILRDQFGAS